MHKQNIRGKYGSMKQLSFVFVFIFTLFLSACHKDELINDCDLPYPDLLCKKYIFENNKCIGYIDYDYNTCLQKLHEAYKNTKGLVRKTILFAYNAQGMISEEQQIVTHSDISDIKKYHYNPLNKIEKIEYFTNDTYTGVKQFYYSNNSLLQKISIFTEKQLDTLIIFEYDTDGKLWRQSYFNKDSSLVSQQIHQFFDNGVERIMLYNANFVYLGYLLIRTNNMGDILSTATYSRNDELLEKTIFEYDNNKLIKETKLDGCEQVVAYNVYFYS